MPWAETDPVDRREHFLADHQHRLYSMAELCARYGVSRKTGYKWLARYDAGGPLPFAGAVTRRTPACIRFRTPSPSRSAPPARRTRPGAPPSSFPGCGRATHASPGRP